MRNYLFNENMKMANLILVKPILILLLPRFGVPLGFGDKSVKELCDEHGIAVDFFLIVCNIYSFDNYMPSQDKVESTDMSMLCRYLEESHRYYLDQRLPHIANHINRISGEMKTTAGVILKRFFEEYNSEVEFEWNEKVYSITHPDGIISICEGNKYSEAKDYETGKTLTFYEQKRY